MTTNETNAKIVTISESGTEVFIPLNKLKKSPRNARKTPHSEAIIEAYAASIAAKGILQNLVVEPELDGEGAQTGFYFVSIGEGRRQAQLLRVKRKQIKKSEPMRCVIDTVNDAHEISLDENITREAMYSPNRPKQIEFVTQNLKQGGIFVFVEKFRAVDEDDYQRREEQKDHGFKARYFPHAEIERKKTAVLGTMFNNEVTLEEMARAVSAHFNHCIMTWNSGNFCSLAASNSKENLDLYVAQMPAAAIPYEYVYESICTQPHPSR